ncbi:MULTISPECIES: MOSC domain-containing protein [Chelatococcus]|uniref:MOSC domain-containing protein YiiM n=1 Tax=Chelatococcus caeni TaxID=1348468 RepID=A0A840C4I6_9HYPH|nr:MULTISPECIES: MOSC domain-containing protein [Chelatococcus]ALA16722.1 molybdenum cofactor sulfurase [Chelatococcus sp. CO-6]MBB4019753.1 MOSC domain-containing protein YiiM [Chelatococcus caeni]
MVTIEAVFAGKAVPYAREGTLSAIDKRRLDAPVEIRAEGLAGDEQGDRKNHGGPDKAVHHYPAEHYDAWAGEGIDLSSFLPGRAAFGENLRTRGLVEADVCIDDIFRVGTALVQVSQARQPCWKLNHRFGRKDMARRVQESGRTGWYYRVLEPGMVASGDRMVLLERPQPQWPLSRVLHVLYVDMLDREALAELARLPHLPASWKALAARRLERGAVEDWSRRLGEG